MKKSDHQKIYIGTSGWSYYHWIGRFYPEKLTTTELLPFYMKHFNTVEINSSFYRLPFSGLIKRWRAIAPAGFVYAVKGSRRVTHIKKIKDAEPELTNFLDRVSGLEDKLGPILWQLPPSLKKDEKRLAEFLSLLPDKKKFRYSIEFRNISWYKPEVYKILADHQVAYCIISAPELPTELEVTADFVYIRFHGITDWYAYNYSESELTWWAAEIKKMLKKKTLNAVYIYFNNDYNAYAVYNALRLKELLET